MSDSDSDLNDNSEMQTNSKQKINGSGDVDEYNTCKKSSFQQMLINSSNKFNEMLQNKLKIHNSTPTAKPKTTNSYIEFTPDASSTKMYPNLSPIKNEMIEGYNNDDGSLNKSKKLKRKKLHSSDVDDNLYTKNKSEKKSLKRISHGDIEKETVSNQHRKKNKKIKEILSDSNNSDDEDSSNEYMNNYLSETVEENGKSDFNIEKKNHANKMKQENKNDLDENSNSSLDFKIEIDVPKNDKQNQNKARVIKNKKKNYPNEEEIKTKRRSKTKSLSMDDTKDLSLFQLHNKKHTNADTSSEESDSAYANVNSKEYFEPQQSYSNKDTTVKLKLEEFVKYKSLSRIYDDHNFITNLKPNEELFIIQIPKTVDPNQLIGTKISLQGKSRVPEDTRKYDCISTETDQKQISVMCNTGSVCSINIAGSLKIQKHLKNKHTPEFTGAPNDSVSFPNNLKQRHPLFGSDYEKKITLEEHIKEKLKAAIESYNKQKQLEEEQKKKNPEQKEEIFELLNQKSNAKKKSKKSKKQLQIETCEIKNNKRKQVAEKAVDSPKKKRQKKHSQMDDSLNIDNILLSESLMDP